MFCFIRHLILIYVKMEIGNFNYLSLIFLFVLVLNIKVFMLKNVFEKP